MKEALRLVFLDAYHAGDPTVAQRLARVLLGSRHGSIILTDPSDRLLLSMASLAALDDDADVLAAANAAENALAAQLAVTSHTRSIAAGLSEFQVPAVPLRGSDRGLVLHLNGGARIDMGDWDWLVDLAKTGAVPTVAPVARNEDGSEVLVDPVGLLAAAASKLAAEISGITVFDHALRDGLENVVACEVKAVAL